MFSCDVPAMLAKYETIAILEPTSQYFLNCVLLNLFTVTISVLKYVNLTTRSIPTILMTRIDFRENQNHIEFVHLFYSAVSMRSSRFKVALNVNVIESIVLYQSVYFQYDFNFDQLN